MKREKRVPLMVNPGMTHDVDLTQLDTVTFTDGDKVRFYKGRLRKLGGWKSTAYSAFSSNTALTGCPRCIFSLLRGNDRWVLIGTSDRVYALKNSVLTNITPVKTSTTAIANSINTNYGTLGNNPFTTVNGSTTVTVTHTAHKLQVNDSITLSGAAGAVNGVPQAQLNATHIVRSIPTANSYTIRVTTAATSSGTGGGASIVEATPIISVSATSNGLSDRDRVKIASAATTGGIPDTEINAEHIIRNVSTNAFDVVVTTKATSSVSNGGGASTTYQKPIDAGSCDRKVGAGYGMGLYNAGLYGVSKEAYDAVTNAVYPRLWSMDRFGNNVIMTPGNQTNLYEWAVDTDTAPTPVTAGSAPTAINYCFVTDNIAVVFGSGGVENYVQWSDLGNLSQWVSAASNQAGGNTLRDAGRLLSHLPVRGGGNLIFSNNKIYTMRYVPGSSYTFEIKKLWDSDGIIAQNARASLGGMGYFWGNSGAIYAYNGSYIQEISSTTLKRYILSRLTTNQREKIFAGVCREFNEVWFFYPSSSSSNDDGFNEVDSYIIYNPEENWWVTGSMERTAMEYPSQIDNYQYLTGHDGVLYTHENGKNDDTAGMAWEATTNYVRIAEGTRNIEVSGLMIDGIQIGNIYVDVYTRPSPRGEERSYGTYTVTEDTSKVSFRAYGNQIKHRFSGNAVDGDFQFGAITEFAKEGGYR